MVSVHQRRVPKHSFSKVTVGAGSIRCYEHIVLRDETMQHGEIKKQSSVSLPAVVSYIGWQEISGQL